MAVGALRFVSDLATVRLRRARAQRHRGGVAVGYHRRDYVYVGGLDVCRLDCLVDRDYGRQSIHTTSRPPQPLLSRCGVLSFLDSVGMDGTGFAAWNWHPSRGHADAGGGIHSAGARCHGVSAIPSGGGSQRTGIRLFLLDVCAAVGGGHRIGQSCSDARDRQSVLPCGAAHGFVVRRRTFLTVDLVGSARRLRRFAHLFFALFDDRWNAV